MLYQHPAIQSRVEVGYIWLKMQRVDHLSSCLASCCYLVQADHRHLR
jgi:hypothetical protein